MRVVFWGTPDFAVPSLRALGEEGHDVVAVVTNPDRPAGRGRTLTASPVKRAAEDEGIPVLTPEKPRGDAFMDELRAIEPEINVVVAYGHILVREVLDLPERGSLNVHASLLPALRGAAPVNWAIARGYETTGVTVMRMVEALDAGPILMQAEEPIGPGDTASDLTMRLSEVGASTLVQALVLLAADALEEREQNHDLATYAPKVDRATARVIWDRPATDVANHVRGMDEVPGAWSTLDGQSVKLFSPVALTDRIDALPPGSVVLADEKEGLVITAGAGAVRIEEVQPPGKRRMRAEAWIRGRGASTGDVFE